MIEIIKVRKCRKNTLQAFLSVRMSQVGLEIRDISLHRKDGKQWLTMPSRPFRDSERNRKYAFILDWFNKDRKAQFETEVLRLLQEGHHGRVG